MNTPGRNAALPLVLFALALVLSGAGTAAAQDDTPQQQRASSVPRRDEINHEVQLYLLAASGDAGRRGDMPEALNGVARQLRAALPFAGYRLAATFFHRVRDGGSVELRGVGCSTLAADTAPHGFNTCEFTLGGVRLGEDPAGQRFVHFRPFRFNLRVPVQTGSTRTESGSFPVIQHENTGLVTEISVREGEPTVVGTITTSRPGDMFVLVVSAKRTGARP